jgi:glyoxylate reductase
MACENRERPGTAGILHAVPGWVWYRLSMSVIFVTTPELPESALEILRAAGEVRVWDGEVPIPHDALLAGVADADAVVCLLSERIDEPLLERAPRLRVVSNVAVGYNNVDVEAARHRSVVVTNTPDVLTEATADLTMALVLAAARRLGEAERYLREGRFERWGYRMFWGAELNGKRLGVVGYGRIGRAVGHRAEAFGMTVEGVGSSATAEDVDALVASSDVVSLHVPLTPETRRLVDARRLALMKPTAFLVNTSRGEVVDEAALAEALHEGRLAGAGLDVFEREPEVHPRLLEAPGAVLVPHIGSATRETRTAMAELAARNAVAALAGRARNQV